jgi:hypothetical protein
MTPGEISHFVHMDRIAVVMDAAMEPLVARLEANGLIAARHHFFWPNWWRDRVDS